jgi:hypothetical protein
MVIASVLLWCSLPCGPQEPASPGPKPATPDVAEDRYVAIETVPLPAHVVLEVGGLAARGDEWFVATRRGEIWRMRGGATAPQWSLWAEGLQEPLGLLDVDGWLYCAQRGELSRLRDGDGDGRADELETVAQGWPLSGNYHEYAFGPTLAGDGSFWLSLNKPFGDEPFGRADWRGFALRIPRAGGSFEPVCAGLRSPAGIGTAPDGGVWYTDNQGEWCAACKFAPLQPGDFHGHPWGIDSCKLPASKVAHPGKVPDGQRLAAVAAQIPNFRLPAVWIPYDKLGRSAAGFVWDTAGHFGPYRGQVFCGDQYSAEVFRISLEQVDGRWQGACYPFRRGLQSGITRLHWGGDGALWCGLTNRGWGSLGKREHGLQRLVWRGELPFDLLAITATPDGFALQYTMPLQADSVRPEAVKVSSWTYDHHEAYGCPERDVRPHAVLASELSADGLTVRLRVDGMENVRVYEIDGSLLRAAADGATPWHGRGWYTRNRAP